MHENRELPIPKPRHLGDKTVKYYFRDAKYPKILKEICFVLDARGDIEIPDSEKEVPKSEYRRLFGGNWKENYPELI